MSKPIHTTDDMLSIHEFCGPASLGAGKQRMCLQIGDRQLTQPHVAELHDILSRWLIGVGYDYEHAPVAGDADEKCPPEPHPITSRCVHRIIKRTRPVEPLEPMDADPLAPFRSEHPLGGERPRSGPPTDAERTSPSSDTVNDAPVAAVPRVRLITAEGRILCEYSAHVVPQAGDAINVEGDSTVVRDVQWSIIGGAIVAWVNVGSGEVPF